MKNKKKSPHKWRSAEYQEWEVVFKVSTYSGLTVKAIPDTKATDPVSRVFEAAKDFLQRTYPFQFVETTPVLYIRLIGDDSTKYGWVSGDLVRIYLGGYNKV